MNLICLAQQKYLRSYGKKFVCTGKKIRVHRKKNSCAQQKKNYCMPIEILLLAHVVIPTCPSRKNCNDPKKECLGSA